MSPYLVACLVGASLCVAGPAGNADELNQDEVLKLRRSGLVAPFQDIVQSIAKRYADVQILEVELEADDGKYIYEIEILVDDGSVRELEIDAVSGTILEDELED
ncbi:Uncharacterised protein [Halioglobus japonicus]|nr:Uncharacterised protein [Halioglobus japonicus]